MPREDLRSNARWKNVGGYADPIIVEIMSVPLEVFLRESRAKLIAEEVELRARLHESSERF